MSNIRLQRVDGLVTVKQDGLKNWVYEVPNIENVALVKTNRGYCILDMDIATIICSSKRISFDGKRFRICRKKSNGIFSSYNISNVVARIEWLKAMEDYNYIDIDYVLDNLDQYKLPIEVHHRLGQYDNRYKALEVILKGQSHKRFSQIKGLYFKNGYDLSKYLLDKNNKGCCNCPATAGQKLKVKLTTQYCPFARVCYYNRK